MWCAKYGVFGGRGTETDTVLTLTEGATLTGCVLVVTGSDFGAVVCAVGGVEMTGCVVLVGCVDTLGLVVCFFGAVVGALDLVDLGDGGGDDGGVEVFGVVVWLA